MLQTLWIFGLNQRIHHYHWSVYHYTYHIIVAYGLFCVCCPERPPDKNDHSFSPPINIWLWLKEEKQPLLDWGVVAKNKNARFPNYCPTSKWNTSSLQLFIHLSWAIKVNRGAVRLFSSSCVLCHHRAHSSTWDWHQLSGRPQCHCALANARQQWCKCSHG